MPKSNVRFIAIWAALVPVIAIAAALVPALGIEPWSGTQVALVNGELNAASAAILALVAYLWTSSVKEPAALQGATTTLAIATTALGAGFGWWALNDDATQLIVLGAGALLVLALTALGRSVAWAPESVEMAIAKAQTPEAMLAATHPRLHPPAISSWSIDPAVLSPTTTSSSTPAPPAGYEHPDADAAEAALLAGGAAE